jgi:glycosyltransferase involved in cell wall biosynthesis
MILTIITPCFNAISTIESCIKNIQTSTSQFEIIEHLIIDGGSTDGTQAVLEDYATRYNHIRFISEKDNGQSDAMNKGIQMARGEYIGFLNADDTYEPNAINTVLSYILQHNPNFLCGNLNVINEKNELIYVSRPHRNTWKEIYFSQTFPINPASYFYKRSIHDIVGYYNEDDHLTMDLDFFLRFINYYKSFNYIDTTVGNFFVGEETKTFQDREAGNMFRRKEALFERYWRENPIRMRLYAIIQNFLTVKIDPRDRAIL